MPLSIHVLAPQGLHEREDARAAETEWSCKAFQMTALLRHQHFFDIGGYNLSTVNWWRSRHTRVGPKP